MEALSHNVSTPDVPPRRSRAGTLAFIVNILDRSTHNNRAFRTATELLPGKRACDVRTGDLAQAGHVEVLRIRLGKRRRMPSSDKIPKHECSADDANQAAGSGYLDVVRVLRAHGIHCTSKGADWAAANGHLEVVRDLRAHCASKG